MKRLTELTLFTVAVLTLSLLALHGAQKMRISLDAMASNTAKTYLLSKPVTYSAPAIEYTNDDLETDK